MYFKSVACFVVMLLLSSCGKVDDSGPDRAVHWVRTSAEFAALSYQAFNAAHRDFDRLLADSSWSALPWQQNVDDLPPAIITDVDETMVSNVEFQATFVAPFANHKLNTWNENSVAAPMPGAVDFMQRAQAADVTIFYITNRPCETIAGLDDPCPQKAVTIQDLNEAGFSADESNVMLSNERPEWDREKSVRRRHIAETHRVIMVFGDDLGDFIPCTRAKPVTPCESAGTIAGRAESTNERQSHWGQGWYILPNPMHGSWTTVK
jgi:5'-nucleotidase (lipoprotein e(P4) family)